MLIELEVEKSQIRFRGEAPKLSVPFATGAHVGDEDKTCCNMM